jgi:ZIP family zinc transporter
MFLFFALLAHNFPEGLAVAASTAQSKDLGITVTVGIMIHNIPEGIAIAIPCMKARPNAPWLAFLLASVSGLAEPLGAALTIAFLRYAKISSSSAIAEVQSEGGGLSIVQSLISLEDVLAFVAGIMTMVALSELFPEARRHLDTSCSNRDYSSNNVTKHGSSALKTNESLTRTGASKTSFLAGTLSGIFIMLLTEWLLDS